MMKFFKQQLPVMTSVVLLLPTLSGCYICDPEYPSDTVTPYPSPTQGHGYTYTQEWTPTPGRTQIEGCYAGTIRPDSYEVDDSFDGAKAIESGEQQQRNFHRAGDPDFVSIYLTAGQTIDAQTLLLDQVDTVLSLLDSDGRVLTSNDDWTGYASRVQYQVRYSGMYYLKVNPYEYSGCTGDYDLLVDVLGGSNPYPDDITPTPITQTHTPQDITYPDAQTPLDVTWEPDSGEETAPDSSWEEDTPTAGAPDEDTPADNHQIYVDIYEPDNAMQGASRIKLGEDQNRSFHNITDVDYVWYYSEEGGLFEVNTRPSNEQVDPIITLLSDDKQVLADVDEEGPGEDEVVSIELDPGESFYIRIMPANAQTLGQYVLNLIELE